MEKNLNNSFIASSRILMYYVSKKPFLKPAMAYNLQGYDVIRNDRIERNCGGVASLIRQGISYAEVDSGKGNIEYITIEINMSNRKLKISNIYCPPDKNPKSHEFQRFFCQRNAVLVGDFNAHHSIFGSSLTNARGRTLENLITSSDFTVLNTGAATHINHSGGESPLDLTIASRNLATISNWTVLRDPIGSDHFPKITKIAEPALMEEYSVPRWSYKKADWKKFKSLCHAQLNENTFKVDQTENTASMYQRFAEIVQNIAYESIPKIKQKQGTKCVPYWNDACQDAVDRRNEAMNRMKETKDPADCLEYRRRKGVAQRIIKDAKKDRWRSYCNSLNDRTKMGEVWKTTKNMNGINTQYSIPNMKINNVSFETSSEKAQLFVETFAGVSADINYTPEFKTNRANFHPEEPEIIQQEGSESINDDFEYHELKQAIQQSKKNSRPGLDTISYEILKEIPKNGLLTLLKIYNLVWNRGTIPNDWKHAVVVPILKPTKPNDDPFSYRPISLTSNLCKIMERLIANRLCWFLEKNKLYNKNQSGFRRYRSCIDQIMRLQDDISNTLHNKGHTLGVFIDLEKAFDMLWRDGLLYKLRKIGVCSNMLGWISDFLSNRTIQVRIGSELSERVQLQNGSPQGSVLSPILYLVMVNDIPDTEDGVRLSMFADDCSIWRSGSDLEHNSKIVQAYFNKFQEWCDKRGFKISTSKTTAIIFSNKPDVEENASLKIRDEDMKFNSTVKFLGVIFDKRLTLRAHIQYIVNRCNKRMNLLRAVSGNDWGADKRTLLTLYRTLIRSVVDYGSIAYDSASKTNKKLLDQIQSKALRICCGAMMMTPIVSMQVDCGETSFELRRKELQLNYAAKLKASVGNPTKSIMEETSRQKPEKYAPGKEPFAVKTCNLNQIIGHAEVVEQKCCTEHPPWKLSALKVDSSLVETIKKKNVDTQGRKRMEDMKIEEYSSTIQVHSDASKKN